MTRHTLNVLRVIVAGTSISPAVPKFREMSVELADALDEIDAALAQLDSDG